MSTLSIHGVSRKRILGTADGNWGADATSVAARALLAWEATEPKGSYAVHALKRKRAQIAGYIADHERKARDWRVALAHVDATLKLFDDELDPEVILPKRVHRKTRYFRGKSSAS